MRQWTVDVSSDRRTPSSPYSPFSPASQRSTTHSLRSLPTNVERQSPGKRASAFPSAPDSWWVDRPPSQVSLDGGIGAESFRSDRASHDHGQHHGRLQLAGMGEADGETLDGQRARSTGNEEEDEWRPRGQRLSRHIPQRTEMDMSVSTYNLLESVSAPDPAEEKQSTCSLSVSSSLYGGARGPRRPGTSAATGVSATSLTLASGAGGSSAIPASSFSTTTSFSDSHISDDSSYMTSLYNDMLAEKLISDQRKSVEADGLSVTCTAALRCGVELDVRTRVSEGSSSNGRGSGSLASGPGALLHSNQHRRGGIGGEVLRFGGRDRTASARSDRGSSARGLPSSEQRGLGPAVRAGYHGRASSSARGSATASSHARVLCTNPERVLDAPDFPTNNSAHLIDWGSNNKLIIGLKSSLYAWDAESGEANKLVELQGGLRIDCVQWLHKCACVALSVGGGTTAIYDCRSEEFVRTVRLPTGLMVAGIAMNGPVMAVASNGARGTTQAFDLRAKNALVATYEGHTGAVTALQYGGTEPFYLATGGEDGHVRVWDARRGGGALRYAFDGVHNGPVTALQWNPEKRSRLFTGGQDGVLCLLDTHASVRTLCEDRLFGDEDNGPMLSPAGSVSCSGGRGTARGPSSRLLGSGERGAAAPYITRAVKSPYPISGMAVQGGEVVTAHRGQGQLQLRKASTFHLQGVFSAPNCTQSLSCLVLAPDREVVCAAQEDETLKFWRVFDASPRSSFYTSTAGSGRAQPSSCLPLHIDAVSQLEEQLR